MFFWGFLGGFLLRLTLGSIHRNLQNGSIYNRGRKNRKDTTGGEPREAPNHHLEGRPLHASNRYPGVHVCWRGQRCTGPVAELP